MALTRDFKLSVAARAARPEVPPGVFFLASWRSKQAGFGIQDSEKAFVLRGSALYSSAFICVYLRLKKHDSASRIKDSASCFPCDSV